MDAVTTGSVVRGGGGVMLILYCGGGGGRGDTSGSVRRCLFLWLYEWSECFHVAGARWCLVRAAWAGLIRNVKP